RRQLLRPPVSPPHRTLTESVSAAVQAQERLKAGSWKLEAGSWKLEAGSWKLEKAWGGCHLTSTLALLGGSPPGGSMPRDPPCGNFLYRLKACVDAPETRGTAFPAGG